MIVYKVRWVVDSRSKCLWDYDLQTVIGYCPFLAKNQTIREGQMPSMDGCEVLHTGKYEIVKIRSLTLLIYRELEYV